MIFHFRNYIKTTIHGFMRKNTQDLKTNAPESVLVAKSEE